MASPGSVTLMIEDCLCSIKDGDNAAIDRLMDVAYDRLVEVTERIVGSMTRPGRGVRASDVFQDSYLRLCNAMIKDNVNPATAGEFMGLAARHIRFQVLDTLRSTRHTQPVELKEGREPEQLEKSNDSFGMWIAFFEAFDELPDDQRQVADLLWTWVEGKGSEAVPNMTQYEAAEVLGITRDRVKDLWRKARIQIAKQCSDFDPVSL